LAVELPRALAKAPAQPLSRAEQIQNFIDSLRVTGVRTAGNESKALVDGHVYRVDDYLDRNLGLKLLKVDTDHLTLVDAAGASYVKNF
jgi:Tfp pilus assembly protein PilP